MPLRIADLTTDYGNIGPQIANLGNQFFAGFNNARKMGMDQQRQQTLAGLAESFKQGQDPDWRGAAQKLMSAGDVEGGLGMLKLGEAVKQRRDTQAGQQRTESMLFGGGMGGGQPPRPMSSGSPMAESSMPSNAAVFPTPEEGRGVISYNLANATRNRPLAPQLATNIEQAVSEVYGPGYKVQVYSGGQGGVDEGGPRVGSTRHDHGNAGDVYIIGPDGQKVTGDRLAPLAQYWQAKGLGGTGLEMASGGIHLDGDRRGGAWNYADQGGRYTPAQAAAVEQGQAGVMPTMAQRSMTAYAGVPRPMTAPDGTPIVNAQASQPQPAQAPRQAPQRATSSLPPDDPFPNATNQQLMAAMGDAKWGDAAKMALQKRYQYAERMDARNAPTEAQKNYEAARRDGFQGTFFEYQRAMREKEVVSGESEENRAIGKKSGEAIAAMAEAAGSAPNNLSRLSRISTMMEQIGTGKLTPSRMTAAQWGRALGVSDDTLKGIGLDPRQAATGEALQAMINQLVVGQIGAGGFPANNFSDADRAFLVQTMPELSKDPRANEIVIEALRRTEQSKVDKAKAYREWKQANPKSTFFDFETEWSDKQASVNKMDDLAARASQLIQGGNPQMPEANKIGASVAPQVGTVSKGYRFKGGDPANQASWEKVN
jgi:hypothetical protein